MTLDVKIHFSCAMWPAPRTLAPRLCLCVCAVCISTINCLAGQFNLNFEFVDVDVDVDHLFLLCFFLKNWPVSRESVAVAAAAARWDLPISASASASAFSFLLHFNLWNSFGYYLSVSEIRSVGGVGRNTSNWMATFIVLPLPLPSGPVSACTPTGESSRSFRCCCCCQLH